MAASRAITRRGFLLASLGLAGCVALGGAASSCARFASGASDASSANAGGEGEVKSAAAFHFGVMVSFAAVCDDSLIAKALERCERLDGLLSMRIAGSDVSKINEAKGAPVEVSPETASIIGRSLEFSRESDGLFDITIGAVSSLWDFAAGIKPSDDEIAEALSHVGYEGVHLDGTTVSLADPLAKIDLGGIAKGAIADDLAGIFREGGCQSALINLGGNVYAVGSSPSGRPWSIGVKDPNDPTRAIASVEGSDITVVTSGVYERSFEAEGRRYHHILDPRTGYPVQTDLDALSLCASDSTRADALSTALFLMGGSRALDFIESDEGLDGLAVDSSGTTHCETGSRFVVVRR